MVQPTDPGRFNQPPTLDRFVLDRAQARSVLAKAKMSSVIMVVADIGREDASQVTFIRHDDVIQAVSTD
jgi:hypothetical protein